MKKHFLLIALAYVNTMFASENKDSIEFLGTKKNAIGIFSNTLMHGAIFGSTIFDPFKVSYEHIMPIYYRDPFQSYNDLFNNKFTHGFLGGILYRRTHSKHTYRFGFIISNFYVEANYGDKIEQDTVNIQKSYSLSSTKNIIQMGIQKNKVLTKRVNINYGSDINFMHINASNMFYNKVEYYDTLSLNYYVKDILINYSYKTNGYGIAIKPFVGIDYYLSKRWFISTELSMFFTGAIGTSKIYNHREYDFNSTIAHDLLGDEYSEPILQNTWSSVYFKTSLRSFTQNISIHYCF